MKKTTATAPASEPVKAKRVKFTPPAFDAKTAVERPHTQLFAHEKTGRTVGFVQPLSESELSALSSELSASSPVHLFGVNRAYIDTVPAAEVPAIEIPPANPPSVVAAVDGEIVQVPTTDAPPAS